MMLKVSYVVDSCGGSVGFMLFTLFELNDMASFGIVSFIKLRLLSAMDAMQI